MNSHKILDTQCQNEIYNIIINYESRAVIIYTNLKKVINLMLQSFTTEKLIGTGRYLMGNIFVDLLYYALVLTSC